MNTLLNLMEAMANFERAELGDLSDEALANLRQAYRLLGLDLSAEAADRRFRRRVQSARVITTLPRAA